MKYILQTKHRIKIYKLTPELTINVKKDNPAKQYFFIQQNVLSETTKSRVKVFIWLLMTLANNLETQFRQKFFRVCL